GEFVFTCRSCDYPEAFTNATRRNGNIKCRRYGHCTRNAGDDGCFYAMALGELNLLCTASKNKRISALKPDYVAKPGRHLDNHFIDFILGVGVRSCPLTYGKHWRFRRNEIQNALRD